MTTASIPVTFLRTLGLVLDLSIHYGSWLMVSNILLSIIYGIILPIDFHMFQDGWNHQPDSLWVIDALFLLVCYGLVRNRRLHWFTRLRLLCSHNIIPCISPVVSSFHIYIYIYVYIDVYHWTISLFFHRCVVPLFSNFAFLAIYVFIIFPSIWFCAYNLHVFPHVPFTSKRCFPFQFPLLYNYFHGSLTFPYLFFFVISLIFETYFSHVTSPKLGPLHRCLPWPPAWSRCPKPFVQRPSAARCMGQTPGGAVWKWKTPWGNHDQKPWSVRGSLG